MVNPDFVDLNKIAPGCFVGTGKTRVAYKL